MFSLFRSSKLFRCGFGITRRSISFQSIKLSTFVDKTTNIYNIKNGQFTFTRAFATPAYRERVSVEKTLHQLDQEVRAKGRISGRDIEGVIQAVKFTRNVSASQALLLIRCCGNLAMEDAPARRTELVANVMATLKSLNVEMDISHYNALLKVYLENKTDFSPFDFLKELESYNLRPNRVTYQYLIGTFCIKGDITGATKILELMKESKVPINENIFNYLIMGHSEANDIESAADIINIMREKGIEPSAASYAALLCGYAKCGEIEKIREAVRQCEKEEIYLLDRDYMDVIYALSVNGHERHVDEFIEKMKKYSGYNQDIVNLVYRLVNQHKDEVVLKLIKSMENNPALDHKNGMFLMYYLMKNNAPIQRLVYFAKGMKMQGINDFAALAVLKELLITEKVEDALYLLRNMRECNIEIRAHYFYPLFCQAGRKKDNRKVVDILKLMRGLGVPRTSITIKGFVAPNYYLRDVKMDFGTLYNTGLHSVFVAEALFTENIKAGKIEHCERLAKNIRLQWDKRWTTPLNKALIGSKNVDAYVAIYAHLYDSYMKEYRIIDDNIMIAENEAPEKKEKDEHEDEVILTEGKEDLKEPEAEGNTVLPVGYGRDKEFGEYVIKRLLADGASDFLVPVLEGMLEYGLGIREAAIPILSLNISDTHAIELLKKLASPDLQVKPIVKDTEFLEAYPSIRVDRHSMSRPELCDEDKHFIQVVHKKNVNEAEVLFEEFKNAGTVSRLHYTHMVKIYTLSKKFDKAYNTAQEMLEKFPSDGDDSFNELYYIECLMHLGKFDDAIEYLRSLDFSHFNPEILFNHIIRRYIADNQDLSRLPELMDVGLEKRATVPRHFGAIAFAHVERKEYDKAVEIFEHVCSKYQFPVIKQQLLKEIVLNGNAELLERVTNALADLNGQINSLSDLVGTFAECNKPKQARRLLETPGLQLRDQKLTLLCKKFMELGNTRAIECLTIATKGMKMINRNILYNFLLDSAMEVNDPAKALNLWTEMQEEEITPSDAFLRRLGQFLKMKGLPVPFVVTESDLEIDSRGNVNIANSFVKALEEKNHEKICKIASIATQHGKFIPFGPLSAYLRDEIIVKGKYQEFDELRTILPKFKPYLTYESMALLTYANAEKAADFIEMRMNELAKIDPRHHPSRFPQRSILNLLFRKTELLRKLEKLNKDLVDKNITVLSNVLWCYNFISASWDKAKEIFPDGISSHCISVLRSYCVLKNTPEPLEKLFELRSEYKLSVEDVQNIILGILTIFRKEKSAEKMQRFINECRENGFEHLIPNSFVHIAKGQTSWPSDSNFQEEFVEEDEEKLENLDRKPELRKFEKVKSEEIEFESEPKEIEEPKKPEAKTGSF